MWAGCSGKVCPSQSLFADWGGGRWKARGRGGACAVPGFLELTGDEAKPRQNYDSMTSTSWDFRDLVLGLTLPSSMFIWCLHPASSICYVSLDLSYSYHPCSCPQAAPYPQPCQLQKAPNLYSFLQAPSPVLFLTATRVNATMAPKSFQIKFKYFPWMCNLLAIWLVVYLSRSFVFYPPTTQTSCNLLYLKYLCLSCSPWRSGKKILECFLHTSQPGELP